MKLTKQTAYQYQCEIKPEAQNDEIGTLSLLELSSEQGYQTLLIEQRTTKCGCKTPSAWT